MSKVKIEKNNSSIYMSDSLELREVRKTGCSYPEMT